MTRDPLHAAAAADVLEDLLQWTLPAHRWRDVDQILIRMIEALPDAPPALTAELELISPRRVRRIGHKREEPVDTPPPPLVLERANQLIHDYSPESEEST
ncbi:CATRA system-associated protein [Nonomuraea lactucae]|uniref:CATRA system-associated protein n=1 Tax=Nonomuraea lactucae TaxID=2249762 RepID=UPI000DE29C34|nr:CATRA system-associated protein [Nonomuraea lactucae]